MPQISVLMTVRNEQGLIGRAVQSILGQTLHDLELIVVDDGSTDNTISALDRFEDPRLRVVQSAPVGRAAALNHAIDLAVADVIALADSDDLSVSHRLQSQFHFLDLHPQVDIVGSQMRNLDEKGRTFSKYRFPTEPHQIAARFAAGSMGIANPTACLRRSVYETHGRYDESMLRAQDFDFFLGISQAVTMAALREELVFYRSPRWVTRGYWIENAKYHKQALANHDFQHPRQPWSKVDEAKQTALWLYTESLLQFSTLRSSMDRHSED